MAITVYTRVDLVLYESPCMWFPEMLVFLVVVIRGTVRVIVWKAK
jgi:hypothetical protein